MTERRYSFFVDHEMCLKRAFEFTNYIFKKNNISFYNANFTYINDYTRLFFTSKADEALVSKVIDELIFRLNNKEYVLFDKDKTMTKNKYSFWIKYEIDGIGARKFIDYILKKNNIRISNFGLTYIDGYTNIFFTSEAKEELIAKIINEIIVNINNGEYLKFKFRENNNKKE